MTFGLLFRCGLFFHSFGIYFLIVWSLVMLHFIMEMSGWLPQNSAIILGEYVCSSYEIVCLNWWCIVCKKKRTMTLINFSMFMFLHVRHGTKITIRKAHPNWVVPPAHVTSKVPSSFHPRNQQYILCGIIRWCKSNKCRKTVCLIWSD